MLSRLKRRSPSSSLDPAIDSPSRDSFDQHSPSTTQSPPSPTPSSRSQRTTFTTPVKHLDQPPQSSRTLSPSRALTPSRTRSSRSSSFGSVAPQDRRSLNLSLPIDFGSTGATLLVANGPGAAGLAGYGGAGGAAATTMAVGQGSLSLDHLTPAPSSDGTAPLTLVVQAPELLVDRVGSDTGETTPTVESVDMRTPVPSHHPDFDSRARGNSNPVTHINLVAPAMTRPRSHTTSEVFHPPRSHASSGLDALAAINVSPSPASSRPPSPGRSATASPPSTSHPPSRSTSRSASRSSSISQHPPDNSSLRPPSTTSPVRGRKSQNRSASGGIAGALALSGVALASPNGVLRQPHGLVRLSNENGERSERVSGATSPMSATTSAGQPSARESLDGASSPTGSLSQAPEATDEDAASTYGDVSNGGGGFLSMDQLGDFDDVVSQLGTGYAVASSKRNADFHALFKSIPDDDYLIEDYGCALQREILIQGRLYISEHHLSFYANIFGWVTSLTIPFSEVCSIEKRMTAYVIPNAIQVATMHARHTFASFLSRDTTYDLIGNIWRMVHPVVPMSAALPDGLLQQSSSSSDINNHRHSHVESDDEGGAGGGEGEDGQATSTGVEPEQPQKTRRRRGLTGFRRPRGGTGESAKSPPSVSANGTANGGSGGGGGGNGSGGDQSTAASGEGGKGKKEAAAAPPHPVTVDTCPTLKNLKEVCLDTTFPGKPEKIYNLMFTSGFMKDFWAENQKLMEIQISDWAPQASGSNLLARSMSYIKPLNGSIGPKQTKCLITDESAHVDFDDFVCVVTTTRTPDVPSGSAFAVKTRTSMTWSRGNQCRVVVTTGVEWSKSSFIKGIIEKSCIDGQKTYHSDLEKAMRTYISTHCNEFVEEGQDPDGDNDDDEDGEGRNSTSPAPGGGGGKGGSASNSSPSSPTRTTSNSADDRSSHSSPLGILSDLFTSAFEFLSEQGPVTVGFGALVIILVISNIWTLESNSSSKSSAANAHPAERAARARGEVYHHHQSSVSSPAAGAGGGNWRGDTPNEVASAVRDVLQDYFAAAGHAAIGRSSSSPPSSMATAPALLPADEVKELEALLDKVAERVQRLRGELRLAAAGSVGGEPGAEVEKGEGLESLDLGGA